MGYIAVVDYGVGNLMSVTNALKYVGCESKVTDQAAELERASGIILPGVGAFPDAADKLVQTGLVDTLKAQVQQKPLLGICLGMQLLFDWSSEVRRTDGLGLIPGQVERIETDLKLPHIGWNSLTFPNPSPLFAGLDEGCYVYFVHSFCGSAAQSEHVIAATDYGAQVLAAVQRGNVFGTQFHPEKSGDVGMQILKNFGGLTK